MKITREALKTIVKETMIEESEYQEFFKKALEKAGGSIPKMSEEEKKAFFNKIEKTWKGKGEKNEISETELEEAQSPAQKAAFAKMLAKKDGKDESTDKKEEVKESNINEDKVSNGTVSTLEKGIQRILGTEVNHDINRNGAHEFYIDDAEFVIGVNDGKEKKVAYSFSIYDDGARKYLGKGTAADEKDLIKQVLSIAKKYKKQLLLTTESVVKEAIDFAGWVAIDHKGKRLEIKKSEAKDLYNAKLLAIKKLKVPKSKESMLAIKPAYNESVNEASKEAMGIAALTGTRGSAVEDFILKHELNGKKLFKSITKANLRGRLNFVSALAGKDGNPNQKLTIKLHKENFNEELSTELAFEVITFMERPVMETVMVDAFEKSDIVEMLVNEGINDVLTEGVKAEFNTLVETYNRK